MTEEKINIEIDNFKTIIGQIGLKQFIIDNIEYLGIWYKGQHANALLPKDRQTNRNLLVVEYSKDFKQYKTFLMGHFRDLTIVNNLLKIWFYDTNNCCLYIDLNKRLINERKKKIQMTLIQ